MAKQIPANSMLNLPLSHVMARNDRIASKSSFSTNRNGRHAAQHLEANDFVDLTDDDNRCFVCDKIIDLSVHSLAKAVTYTTKSFVAQKLGELMGEGYIIIVSEDDFICQSCMNLFNRLDNLELELKNTKMTVLKNLETTYLSLSQVQRTVPNYLCKALQAMIDQDSSENNEPLQKKKKMLDSKNILKQIYSQSSELQKVKIEKKDCSIENLGETNKENVSSNQQVDVGDQILSRNEDEVSTSKLLAQENDVYATFNPSKISLENEIIKTDENLQYYSTENSMYSNQLSFDYIIQPALQ